MSGVPSFLRGTLPVDDFCGFLTTADDFVFAVDVPEAARRDTQFGKMNKTQTKNRKTDAVPGSSLPRQNMWNVDEVLQMMYRT